MIKFDNHLNTRFKKSIFRCVLYSGFSRIQFTIEMVTVVFHQYVDKLERLAIFVFSNDLKIKSVACLRHVSRLHYKTVGVTTRYKLNSGHKHNSINKTVLQSVSRPLEQVK